MTIVERARTLAALADNLHAECLEMTLPAGALAVLARSTATHANAILDLIQPRVKVANTFSEANDALLGESRR